MILKKSHASTINTKEKIGVRCWMNIGKMRVWGSVALLESILMYSTVVSPINATL